MKSAFSIALIVVLFFPGLSQEKKKVKCNTWIGFGPSIVKYKINAQHAADAKSKAALHFFIHEELRIRPWASLVSGIGYFGQGLGFSSYYFKPDVLNLYTKEFNYNYEMRLHELNIPFQLKANFNRNTQSKKTFFLQSGLVLRNVFAGTLEVTEQKTGKLIYYGDPEHQFLSTILGKNWGSNFDISFGYRGQFGDGKTGMFFRTIFSKQLNQSLIVPQGTGSFTNDLRHSSTGISFVLGLVF